MLTESMNQIVAENKKLQSDIVMVKNVNRKLEGKIGEQYSHRNNVKMSGIPNSILMKILKTQ